jgi:hypothetical protein
MGEVRVRRSFGRATLTALREMPSEDALALLAIYYKADATYVPIKDSRSRRWHVCTACGEFEILTTGPNKWYDSRAKKGGGGAIDLAMHVLRVPFVDAVKYLIERGHSHG